jgi:maleate isomerase
MNTATELKRIGSLIPSSNTVQEREFSAALPKEISLHISRLKLTHVEAESTIKVVEKLEEGALTLADADVDVLLLGLTAPSSRKGMGYDKVLKKMMEDASGKPATTAATATIEALNLLGVKKLAFCAPWTDEINQFSVRFLEENGFTVPAHQALGIAKNLDIGRLDSSSAIEMALAIDSDQMDAIMLACGNWFTMEVIQTLEEKLGKPVMTTNQVSLWGALKILGCIKTLPGYGVLLEKHLNS